MNLAFFRESWYGEVLFVLGIAVVSLAVSQIVVFLFDRVLKALTRRTSTTLDDLLIHALERPLFLLVFVFGLFVALTAVEFLNPYQEIINNVLVAAELSLVVYGANRVVGALATWYATEVAPRTDSTLDERLLPIARRVATGVIYVLGALMVFRTLGLDVSPLLAGLGIGGLAVALALQPTLNNLIAGAYTVSESKIGVGDYVRLEDGPRPEGVVQDIGWRTTKIRTPQSNIIVIPNAKLADSVVTNFGAPTPEVTVVLSCGVSYESDLEHVERVVDRVSRQVLESTPGAVEDSSPVIRFRSFGDSNINFEVLVRVKSYPDQYPVTTALIKALHKEFQREGIQMNYPVRRLIHTPEDGFRREL